MMARSILPTGPAPIDIEGGILVAQCGRSTTFPSWRRSISSSGTSSGTGISTTTPTRASLFWSLPRPGRKRRRCCASTVSIWSAAMCSRPQTVHKLCRMDPTVDGNPIGWSVKQMQHKLPDMLRAAGYEDIAHKVDAQAVSHTLAEVETTARDPVCHRQKHRQAQPGHRHFRGWQLSGLAWRCGSRSAATAVWRSTCWPTWRARLVARTRKKPNCWPSTASEKLRTITTAPGTRTTASSGTRRWCPTPWGGRWSSSRAGSCGT